MKKMTLITLLFVAMGCSSTSDFENLLFEEEAILIATVEKPSKAVSNEKDDQYPAENLDTGD